MVHPRVEDYPSKISDHMFHFVVYFVLQFVADRFKKYGFFNYLVIVFDL